VSNHPLRFPREWTVFYQGLDWARWAAITVQIGRSPLLELPLRIYIGEQVWGPWPTHPPDGKKWEPVSPHPQQRAGPDRGVFWKLTAVSIRSDLAPAGAPLENGGPARCGLTAFLPRPVPPGCWLKRDPGVAGFLVYTGFGESPC